MKITKNKLRKIILEAFEEIDSEEVTDEPEGSSLFDAPDPEALQSLKRREEEKRSRERWGSLSDEAFNVAMNILQSQPRRSIDRIARAYMKVRHIIHSSDIGEEARPREIEIQEGFDAALSSMIHRTVLGYDEGEIS